MDVAVRVQQHIIGLNVAVYDVLAVDIAQGAAELGYPEADGFFGKCLARDVKSQVAAAHEVDDEVHVLKVLEAVAQVAEERMAHVFEHAPLADNVAHALGPDNCEGPCQLLG